MFKGSGSLFTKPFELMMTHQKDEVFLATQIFRMVAIMDFLQEKVLQQNSHILSVTVDFFLSSMLLYVQSLIINFAEITFQCYVAYLLCSVYRFDQKYK